ncbi:MAG: universal stress protein [Desulfobacter sp.]|nr:MAG: universal stress protein [Desulfobacter sp.]
MRICPKHIMCAVDFSGFAPLILSYGKALAAEFDSALTICHIVQDTVMLSSHAQAGFSTEEVTAQRLEDSGEAIRHLAEQEEIKAESLVSLGHPADEITRLTKEKDVDMVIAATHGGSGIKRFLVGSVTDRLVKTLECPLLVLHPPVRDDGYKVKLPLERILVGCDFSNDSDLAFRHALSLAQEFEAELHLVHVIKPRTYIPVGPAGSIDFREDHFPILPEDAPEDDTEYQRYLIEQVEKRLSRMIPEECCHWCTPITAIRRGEPYQELLDYTMDFHIDMIVLGIHGHSLLDQFLVGSTTDRVIAKADCPVLAVRQTG